MVTKPVPSTGGQQHPDSGLQWALLSYRIPREPSTPRIAVWRKLKDLGVAQLGDGLVALPSSPQTIEHLEWVAAKVLEANGEATVWIAAPSARRNGEALLQQLREARDIEYTDLIDDVMSTNSADMRTIKRWRREWQRIARRDYFAGELRDRARLTIAERSAQLDGTNGTESTDSTEVAAANSQEDS